MVLTASVCTSKSSIKPFYGVVLSQTRLARYRRISLLRSLVTKILLSKLPPKKEDPRYSLPAGGIRSPLLRCFPPAEQPVDL